MSVIDVLSSLNPAFGSAYATATGSPALSNGAAMSAQAQALQSGVSSGITGGLANGLMGFAPIPQMSPSLQQSIFVAGWRQGG